MNGLFIQSTNDETQRTCAIFMLLRLQTLLLLRLLNQWRKVRVATKGAVFCLSAKDMNMSQCCTSDKLCKSRFLLYFVFLTPSTQELWLSCSANLWIYLVLLDVFICSFTLYFGNAAICLTLVYFYNIHLFNQWAVAMPMDVTILHIPQRNKSVPH